MDFSGIVIALTLAGSFLLFLTTTVITGAGWAVCHKWHKPAAAAWRRNFIGSCAALAVATFGAGVLFTITETHHWPSRDAINYIEGNWLFPLWLVPILSAWVATARLVERS